MREKERVLEGKKENEIERKMRHRNYGQSEN